MIRDEVYSENTPVYEIMYEVNYSYKIGRPLKISFEGEIYFAL
jgi:hypothetical protein